MLAEFTALCNDNPILLNPEHVVAITPNGRDHQATDIITSINYTVTVREDYKTVHHKLNKVYYE